jgi:hypothetical protein
MIKSYIKNIKKQTKKILKNKYSARKFLLSTGIYTKTGKLSINYR